MDLKLDNNGSTPIYQQVVEQIQRRIAQGVLVPGDPIPSVRQLALELTINPNTVARAYLELEYQGILQKRQGQGTFVSPDAPSAARREGAALVGSLLERAISEAALFGIGAEELELLFRKAARARAKKGALR